MGQLITETKMTKKRKSIILVKKKTTVEIKDSDGWLFDLRYLVNGRETYSCQITLPDVTGRVRRLIKEGYKKQKSS
jgi:hypothetical protein